MRDLAEGDGCSEQSWAKHWSRDEGFADWGGILAGTIPRVLRRRPSSALGENETRHGGKHWDALLSRGSGADFYNALEAVSTTCNVLNRETWTGSQPAL